MGKSKNVSTDHYFTSFLLAKNLKKKQPFWKYLVRRELSASAKCLQQHYSSELMKAGNVATQIVNQC